MTTERKTTNYTGILARRIAKNDNDFHLHQAAIARLQPAMDRGYTPAFKAGSVELNCGPILFTIAASPMTYADFTLAAHDKGRELPLACGHGSDLHALIDHAEAIAKDLGIGPQAKN